MILDCRKNCATGRHLKHSGTPKHHETHFLALLLCLSMLAGTLPVLSASAGEEKKLSTIVRFQSITLHYAGADGQPEKEAIQNNALIAKNRQLALRYTYEISGEQCEAIQADTCYYLQVSPHLVLPELLNGSALTIETEDGPVEFGKIYADGSQAWVIFHTDPDNGTIIKKYGGISDAYFYLDCRRADNPPENEPPLEDHRNLYAMKFEDGEQLAFGYAENEPVSAAAQIDKNGSLTDKTITWKIFYTPWQNPSLGDPVTLDTSFELRDTLDTSLHDYVKGSAAIGGAPIPEYASRNEIPANSEAYIIVEPSKNTTSLIFGGTKLNAGQATAGSPAKPLTITYETSLTDKLLLPGSGDSEITNAAELFAGKDGAFNSLSIHSQAAVPIPRPTWLEKKGTTTRHTDGSGSTTDWTVTFYPNGFSFTDSDALTLHDRLPDGSTLIKDSVKVSGANTTVTVTENTEGNGANTFTVGPIAANGAPVVITYQTQVPEDMYDNGISLGNNTAWFTFQKNGTDYETSEITAPVGSGDGSGTPGTSALVKANAGYDPATRSIAWTVTINPHKADLKGGTFTDDLSAAGGVCRTGGHTGGLELENGVNGIDIKINGLPPADTEKNLLKFTYSRQVLTIDVGEIGRKTVTLRYTTRVCDPCIFANNTAKTPFKNTISTRNMQIGSASTTEHSASADSTADVSVSVLTKKPPVYDYKTGIMKWTVEVDAAGLPMTEVVLTDMLPAGLSYKEKSLSTDPVITGAAADTEGRELTIYLGTITEKTTVTFDTQVDPAALGFDGGQPVIVENTVHMNGNADGIRFAEVSHRVQQNFSNHGLVKSSTVDNSQELIQYEVLINPYHLSLPKNPALIDTLDPRLQLDTDTLRFYQATLSGTTAGNAQKPVYQKTGDAQLLKIADYDPDANRFTVQLPIPAGSRDAYVLTYTADIIDRQAGSYGNSVRFDGGSVLLGGSKDNSAAVGGGGGGGGGVAARKAEIAVVKTDSENQKPLAGVVFTLYQWDSTSGTRGLPFARGATGAQGDLSFIVKPGAVYELVEEQSLPGYSSSFGWTKLPPNVTAAGNGLVITAGAARSKLELSLTNDAHTTDLVFRLFNHSGIPMAGTTVQLFTCHPAGITDPVPDMEAVVAADGKIRFSGVRRGRSYYIRQPDGEILIVEIPADSNEKTTVERSDGTKAVLTENYRAISAAAPDQQWVLTVSKVTGGSQAPLPNADFGLYAEETCRTLIRSSVSGPDGIVMFKGLMKGQTYWVKERKAPDGYQLNPAVIQINERNSHVTVPNIPKTSGSPESTDSLRSPGKSDHAGSTDISDAAEHYGEKIITRLPNVPPTGDNAPVFLLTALLSGALSAIAVSRFLMRLRKHL